MRRVSRKPFFKAGLAVLFLFAVTVLFLPFLMRSTYSSSDENEIVLGDSISAVLDKKEKVAHVKTPEPMKAIYMTACVAATPSWRSDLMDFVDKTELNAIMIDIKDYSGTISLRDFPLEEAAIGSGCRVRDMKEFIEELHAKNIYVIGRITVFQDPMYAKIHPELAVKSKSTGGVWKDRKGLAFIDVGAKPYWDHIIELSKFSYDLGFDEINFDYVRYPSDGDMDDTHYSWTIGTSTKAEMLENFFSYLSNELSESEMVTSADLFGMTTTVTGDMNIGQVLERALPHFDYIYPMVYPSHYPPYWNNFKNPAEHPYDVIYIAMSEGVARENAVKTIQGIATSTPSKLRPWIQDFDLGAEYGANEIRAQIKATYDAGLTSWLVWDAGNRYTRDAFLKE